MKITYKQLSFILALFTLICPISIYGANDASIEPEQELVHKRYCLSIDGGGLRGTFPATIIRQIECATDTCTSTLFKGGITGTSTGALIALGLAARKNLDTEDSDYNTPLLTGAELVDFCCSGILECIDVLWMFWVLL